jgi:hypothetical protein
MALEPRRKLLVNLVVEPFLVAFFTAALLIVLAKYPTSARFHDHVHARFAIPFGFTLGVILFAMVPAMGEC